jgi:hypothetical protein
MPLRVTPLLACSAAALLAGAVYLNALRNPFVYDDYRTIVSNPTIAHLTNVWPIVLYDRTRPLTNLSFAVDYALWEGRAPDAPPRPLGFHVTNVLLHAFNVALLFVFSRSLAQQGGARTGVLAGFTAAALFAVHPLMTEAVGYISGRFEVLCTTLFLGALFAGRRWLRDGAVWAFPTVVLWLAAVTAKETATIFPFVLAACDFLLPAEGTVTARRRLARVHLPLLALAALIGAARLAFLLGVEVNTPDAVHWPYLLVVVDVLRRYLLLLLNPAGQTVFHAVAAPGGLLAARTLSAIGVVAALLFVAWRLRKAEPRVSFGVLWFLLALVPSSTLILLGRGEPMAEHRVYLASAGLLLAAGVGAERVWRWSESRRRFRPWLAAGFALVLISFAVETVLRNRVWADPVGLWREAAVLAPGHYRPRLLLGEALHDAGRRDEAIVQFRAAIQMRPDDPASHGKLGQVLAEVGRFADARPHLEEALRLDPGDAAARRALALLNDLETQ